MTQSAVKFLTLGELRKRLQTRLGGVAGLSFGITALDEFIREAQSFWYNLVEWKHLRASVEYPIVRGSRFYDLPEDVNLECIFGIWIRENGDWHQMCEGISVAQRNYDNTSYTRRFDIGWNNTAAESNWKLQIELFPEPREDSRLRYEYKRAPLDLENVYHVASIPHDLILAHATYFGKMHFRQPDAPAYKESLDRLVAHYRGRHRRAMVITAKPQRDMTYAYPPKWE